MNETRIIDYLKQKNKYLFENIQYFKNGYTFSSLYRIMQADVPIVVVAEEVTSEEVVVLKQIRKNVCIIAINDTWRVLLEQDIYADFLVGNLGEGIDERLNGSTVIVDVESEDNSWKNIVGKHFFYCVDNVLVGYLCNEAQKKINYPYNNNIVEQFPLIENIYSKAIYIAEYLNGDKIFLIGVDENEKDNLHNDRMIWIDRNDFDKLNHLKEICQIECHISNTINELFPLFDEIGKREFDSVIEKIINEIHNIFSYINRSDYLYNQLYEIALAEEVSQSVLNDIVENINDCIQKLNEVSIAYYVSKLSEDIGEIEIEYVNKSDNINEIAMIAVDGICESKKQKIIYEFMLELFSEMLHTSIESDENSKEITVYKKVLIVHGNSKYNVLPSFVNGIKKGFHFLGYDVHIWNVVTMKSYGYNIYQNTIGYDYIILINGVMIDYMVPNMSINAHKLWYDNRNSKIVSIFVDHPKRHYSRLKYCRNGIEVFYSDKYWCDYIKRYMPEIKGTRYLIEGGVKQEEYIDFINKENKIVFFGSERDLSKLSEDINQSGFKVFIWNIIERLIENPCHTIEEEIRLFGMENDCLFSAESILIYSPVFELIETYIRAYFRDKVVMEIAKSGIPFDIYGWKSEEIGRYDNVTLKEPVDFEKMLEICRHTRFVLNVQPWSKDGVQERVFNAMFGGSISVTDVSDLLENDYEDEKSILFYRLDKIYELPEKVLYYIEHTEEAAAIAREGYKVTNEKHTWEKYVRNMIEILNMQNDKGEELCK